MGKVKRNEEKLAAKLGHRAGQHDCLQKSPFEAWHHVSANLRERQLLSLGRAQACRCAPASAHTLQKADEHAACLGALFELVCDAYCRICLCTLLMLLKRLP
eukprot:3818547-Pleurochrysis_carterae.AAC.5